MTANKAVIRQLFVVGNFDECLQLIESVAVSTKDSQLDEYFTYIKALIKRKQGSLQECLQLLQSLPSLSVNYMYLKQVAITLFLCKRYRMALEIFGEHLLKGFAEHCAEDWTIHYYMGLCYIQMQQFGVALDCFQESLRIQPSDQSFDQLGRLYLLIQDFEKAEDLYLTACKESPDNSEFLLKAGLLAMRRHDYPQAFDMFGRCLLSDPFNHPAVLAMGTMLQQHGEPHAGLMKYRVLANSHHLNSSLMWNNIGMAFYHRQKFIAGLACLKRALYLAPMDWRLLHNLGLICLRSHQYASANIYLTAAALINPEHGQTFHWLAVTLVQLDDYRNAMQSYEYAMQHAPSLDCRLNFSVTLYRMGERERSLQELLQVIDGWNAAKQQQQNTNYRLPAENELKQSINALAALHDLPPPISDE